MREEKTQEGASLQPPVTAPARYSFSLERVPFAERIRKEGPLSALAFIILSLSFAGPYLKSRNLWIDIPCIFRKVTHLPCLACGITRSFMSSAHGDFRQAFKFHLLGPALFFALVGIFAYFLFCILSGWRFVITVLPETRRKTLTLFLMIAIIAWACKLLLFRKEW